MNEFLNTLAQASLDIVLRILGVVLVLVIGLRLGKFLAKKFKEAAEITGLVLTKLDGTAKGGAVFSIKNEVDLPVKFIGIGEQIDDMKPFDAKMFVDALLGDGNEEYSDEEDN